jgi:hypothetical protein
LGATSTAIQLDAAFPTVVVTALQETLVDNGSLPSTDITVYYSPLTTNAVAQLEEALNVNAGADLGDYGPL